MKVLFITQSKVSDAVVSTVVLDRILAAHPDATIDIAAEKRVANLFTQMPNLGKLMRFKASKGGTRVAFKIWRKFVGSKYDFIIDLQNTSARHFLSGRKKVTFALDSTRQKSDQLCELFPLVEDRLPQQILWDDPEVSAKIDQFVKNERVLIGLAPGGSWLPKSWPQRYFAFVVNKIVQYPNFENATFVVFGTEKEKHLISDLIKHIPEDKCINLVGRTTLNEAFSWMRHLDGFLGNDCGASHLAAAAGIPVVTLFGPTSEKTNAPLARNVRLVVAPERKRSEVNLPAWAESRVMTDIKPDHVFEVIVGLIEHLKEEYKKNA